MNEKIRYIKEKYKKGCRVKAIFINDTHGAPYGSLGYVESVDDIETVFINWDNDGYVKGEVIINGKDRIEKI